MIETNHLEEKKFTGFTGSTLKIIAIITMLIDHIGAVILEPFLTPGFQVFNPQTIYDILYIISRTIGRIAFPLFCFLLVQGFIHTSNVKKYALRLGAFALISEIPFDMAMCNGSLFDFSKQNVFFTLLIGLITLYLMDKYKEKRYLGLIFLFLAAGLTELINADYGMFGILPIGLFYLSRESKKKTMLAGLIAFFFEAPLFLVVYLSLPLIYFYNGKRGLSIKYFFYAFYPLHLLFLYLIKTFVLQL